MRGIDAKAELVRAGIPFYVAAGEVRLHPSRFAKFLNSTQPLPERLGRRIEELIAGHQEVSGV